MGAASRCIDQKLDTQDQYFIAQTPLKFLLNDHIDIAKDTTSAERREDNSAVTIEIEDKATFGGTARSRTDVRSRHSSR